MTFFHFVKWKNVPSARLKTKLSHLSATAGSKAQILTLPGTTRSSVLFGASICVLGFTVFFSLAACCTRGLCTHLPLKFFKEPALVHLKVLSKDLFLTTRGFAVAIDDFAQNGFIET